MSSFALGDRKVLVEQAGGMTFEGRGEACVAHDTGHSKGMDKHQMAC